MGNLHHLSQKWLATFGLFDVSITPHGDMMLMHERFRDRGGRVLLKDVIPWHLEQDLRECTIFYLDSGGRSLGNINAKHWILEDDMNTSRAVKVSKSEKLTVTLTARKSQGVPRRISAIEFRFEHLVGEDRFTKFSFVVHIKRDLRITPPKAVSDQDRYLEWKKRQAR